MKKRNFSIILFSLFSLYLLNSNPIISQQNNSKFSPPAWSKNISIYEVNVRQFTPEGTFKAFGKHLPRLKEMNIGILWFMPINPIGKENRKGTLGSYYSVQDYKGINPEFGSLEDIKSVVKEAHKLGMYVIIDWVANHTSWDNVWVKSNPEFFSKDKNGKFISPFDWSDVIDLNYDNKELWNQMRDAMEYWITECDIDGFRCDVAAMVPTEFWIWLRPQLEKKKPIFMLAEAHEPELHKAFDMTYNWQLKDLFVGLGKKEKSVKDFYDYFEKEKTEYPKDAYRMTFTSNHDENSWNGTDKERFGDARKMFAVLSCLVPGMPLVYSGQEASLDKRLLFFERDPIEWKESALKNIYKKLFNLKLKNRALWNGDFGGKFNAIKCNNDNIFAFSREKGNNKVIALFNFSPSKAKFRIDDNSAIGNFNVLFDKKNIEINTANSFTLEAWGYMILYK